MCRGPTEVEHQCNEPEDRHPPSVGLRGVVGLLRPAVIPAPHSPVEIRSFPRPKLEPGSALLRVTYSEACGTDLHHANDALETVRAGLAIRGVIRRWGV